MKKDSSFVFFIAPSIIFLVMFCLAPLFALLLVSFSEYNIFIAPRFVGFDNYISLLYDKYFWACFFNSLFFILASPILIVLSLTLALMARSNSSANKIFRAIFFIPSLTPVAIVGIMWQWIFSEDFGILNFILTSIGLQKVKWLSTYPLNLFSVLIAVVWRGAGYYMMIFLAALSALPEELEEAAKIDGANNFQIAVKIIIPQIWNSIIFVFIISASSAIRLFSELYIMIPGAPTDNKTLVYYLYSQAFEKFNIGYGSTLAFVLFLLTLAFSYANIKIMEKQK